MTKTSEDVPIPRAAGKRKLHKAFLRYHDPANWPLLREALKAMGRADLIGNGKKHLVPEWQPAGTTNPRVVNAKLRGAVPAPRRPAPAAKPRARR